MQDRIPRIQFDFPVLTPQEWGEGLRLCLTSWSARTTEADQVASLASMLSDFQEAERLTKRISHRGRRAESFLARVAREELARRYHEELRHCSWSHTRVAGRIVAAALFSDRAAVGVDIEAVDRLSSDSRVLRRTLSAREQLWFESLRPDQRGLMALRFWCAKESLAKALGTGLLAPLSQYEVRVDELNLMQTDALFQISFRHFPDYVSVVEQGGAVLLARCRQRSPRA